MELNPHVYVFDILIFVFKTFHNCPRLQPEELWFYKILWEVKFKFDNLDEKGHNYFRVFEWDLHNNGMRSDHGCVFLGLGCESLLTESVCTFLKPRLHLRWC